MLYHHLFNQKSRSVSAAVIGTGHFGKAVVTQQKYNEFIEIRVVMDKNLESAKQSYQDAGIDLDKIIYSNEVEEANRLYEEGYFIYTDNLDVILKNKKIEVVCEGTGIPEAGAVHALKSIEHNKHVAMINKETDSAIGPILKKLAQDKGVVYTPVDGDQHGLLMQMYEWAKQVGLTVVSGGKSRDGEFIYNEEDKSVTIEKDGITVHETVKIQIKDEDLKYLKMIPEGKTEEYLMKRKEILKKLPGEGAFDLCELTIMANATTLSPPSDGLKCSPLRITELPVAYCHTSNGGIYKEEGIIDLITNFRRKDESGMGGGVYLVVRCDNAYSNYILTTKGQIPNYDKSTAVIYRPYHLCGVETSTSIASAGLLNLDTGSISYTPRYDLVKYADRDIKAGEILGNDHDYSLKADIQPAKAMESQNAVPGHLITNNIAKVDIKKGELITYDKIIKPEKSILWELRELQDKTFLK